MKHIKGILSLVTAILTVSAAIFAVVVFQDEIRQFFRSLKQFCSKAACSGSDEYADFADV